MEMRALVGGVEKVIGLSTYKVKGESKVVLEIHRKNKNSIWTFFSHFLFSFFRGNRENKFSRLFCFYKIYLREVWGMYASTFYALFLS